MKRSNFSKFQLDLVGRYLRDYVHADDWREFRDRLCNVGTDAASSIFLRMKTALTPRGGRARKLTMAVYQVGTGSVLGISANHPKGSFCSIFSHFKHLSSSRHQHVAETRSKVSTTTLEVPRQRRRTMISVSSTAFLSPYRRHVALHQAPRQHSPVGTIWTCVFASATNRKSLRSTDQELRELWLPLFSFAHALGFKPKSFIGRSFFDLIHPEDAQRVAEAVKDSTPTSTDAVRLCSNCASYSVPEMPQSDWLLPTTQPPGRADLDHDRDASAGTEYTRCSS